MTEEIHVCANEGCQRPISDNLFACRNCWFSLPGDIRSEIWRSHGALKEGKGGAWYSTTVLRAKAWFKTKRGETNGAGAKAGS